MTNTVNNPEYVEFVSKKKSLAEIQRPKQKNFHSGNFSIQQSEMKKGIAFYYDWNGQYGEIPYDVIRRRAVAHTCPCKKQLGKAEIYYLISKTWLTPYLKII